MLILECPRRSDTILGWTPCWRRRLAWALICIDPGHGGADPDPGAVANGMPDRGKKEDDYQVLCCGRKSWGFCPPI
ncbi:hypothetical protein [Effusibacillus lacus]|uniref:hypothetical protein n=1 Tax=Effusibacillus lacus TaxID=1348429 RepID=UPI001405452D|nr:hypothetical protein [Effusibacillus lacus]